MNENRRSESGEVANRIVFKSFRPMRKMGRTKDGSPRLSHGGGHGTSRHFVLSETCQDSCLQVHTLEEGCSQRGAAVQIHLGEIPGHVYCEYCRADLGEDAWDDRPWGRHFCSKVHRSNYYHRQRRRQDVGSLERAIKEKECLERKLVSKKREIYRLKASLFGPTIQKPAPSAEDYRPLRRYIQKEIQGVEKVT